MPNRSKFKQEFTSRIREARLSRRLTQEQIAGLLGLEQGKYKQYEKRSYLPHELIANFCLIVGCDISWLYTGEGVAPAQIQVTKQPQPVARPRRRSKAA